MPRWEPGELEVLLKEIEQKGRANQRKGLLLIAHAIETVASEKLRHLSHAAGTPSPAGRGQPPAMVTGTLSRSLGHEYYPGLEPKIRVGLIEGIFPPARLTSTNRGTRSRAARGTSHQRSGVASSEYGFALEHGPHPFLLPSYHEVVAGQIRIWMQSFREWPRL